MCNDKLQLHCQWRTLTNKLVAITSLTVVKTNYLSACLTSNNHLLFTVDWINQTSLVAGKLWCQFSAIKKKLHGPVQKWCVMALQSLHDCAYALILKCVLVNTSSLLLHTTFFQVFAASVSHLSNRDRPPIAVMGAWLYTGRIRIIYVACLTRPQYLHWLRRRRVRCRLHRPQPEIDLQFETAIVKNFDRTFYDLKRIRFCDSRLAWSRRRHRWNVSAWRCRR
jgi:hypothetical protein